MRLNHSLLLKLANNSRKSLRDYSTTKENRFSAPYRQRLLNTTTFNSRTLLSSKPLNKVRSVHFSFTNEVKTPIRSLAESPLTPPASETKALADFKDFVVFKDVEVGKLLEEKTKPLVTISKDATVFDAISKMNKEKVGALVILDENKKTLGIFTERDYLNKIALRGLSSKTTKVSDVMTKDLFTVKPNYKAADAMMQMTQNRFRHVPVVDDNNAAKGIISIGDLVKYVIDQQKLTIHYLQEYIHRTY